MQSIDHQKNVIFSDVYMVIFDPQPMTSTEVVDAIWLRTISIACRYYISNDTYVWIKYKTMLMNVTSGLRRDHNQDKK